MARRCSLFGRSIVNERKIPKSPTLSHVTAEAASDWSRRLLSSSSVGRSSPLLLFIGGGISRTIEPNVKMSQHVPNNKTYTSYDSSDEFHAHMESK